MRVTILQTLRQKYVSSVWQALSGGGYLAITYQLVKLLATSLMMAVGNRVESRYMECGILES